MRICVSAAWRLARSFAQHSTSRLSSIARWSEVDDRRAVLRTLGLALAAALVVDRGRLRMAS
jgi:hypothetical protein